jgi:Protein of unknown function (DUF2971)
MTEYTPTQIEIARKLLEIFRPHATQTRADMIQRRGRFVHYTSAENALKIINSKTIWMRNTNCMIDYREVEHGFDTLRRFFAAPPKRDEFLRALDACGDGVGQEALALFDRWRNDIRASTYITSVSEHDDKEDQHGRLSMWRAFAGGTARVALVFKIPLTDDPAASLNLLMLPIAYHTDEQAEGELKLVTTNIKNSQTFLRSINRAMFVQFIYFMLMTTVVCMKHEGFREEREWRIIYFPNQRPSPLISSSIEVVGGVPQTVYKIPLRGGSPDLANVAIANLVDRIIIGPSPYPWPMYEAFVAALTTAGVTDARSLVFVSGIPIRS